MLRKCLLGDVITLKRGYDLPAQARSAGSVPIVSSSGVSGTHREAKVKGPGVITGRYGTIGEIHFVRNDFWPLNTTLYVQDFKGNDPRFVSYFLKTLNFASRNAAAAVPGVNRNDLHRLPVLCPEVQQQLRIATILSAYDDLIENNTRRIAILEEMARRIYEEWFVRFHFPGHENVRLVESELGRVPEGWKYCSLGSLVEHHIGGGWGQEEANDEFSVSAYVIRGTDIADVRGGSLGRAPRRFHRPSNFRSRELKARDIVFEVSGGSKDQPVGRSVLIPAGLLAQTQEPVICASFCRLVRANVHQILPELLHLHFDRIYASREIMQYQTQSTGITNFKFTVFLEKEMILKPAAEVQERFAQVLLPMLGLVERLGTKNASLRATRDLLLPKLISGELDVSAMREPEAATA
jgi:type I restriction enzyme, S subunit